MNCTHHNTTDNALMPPPSHTFIEGSQDYHTALATGQLQVSLPTNAILVPHDVSSSISTSAANQQRTTALLPDFGSPPPAKFITSRVVSPPELSLLEDEMDTFENDENEPPPPPPTTSTTQQVSSNNSTDDSIMNEQFQPNNKAGVDMDFDPEPTSDATIASQELQQQHHHHQQRCSTVQVEETRFADIIGHGSAKLHMEEVLLPLALPADIAAAVFTGARAMPASVLLYGPPGCGKTQLARAMAGEASAALLQVAPSDILSKFVGESEASVRAVFKKASEQALQLESKCAVVFFDEIDALGQSRDDRGSGEGEGCSRRVLAELLMVMSEITDRKRPAAVNHNDAGKDDSSIDTTQEQARIIVVAATNRIFDLDPALKRRFGIQLPIDPPSKRDRKTIMLRQLNGIEYAIGREEFDHLVQWLEGWTGSGLSSLVREAAMTPVRECLRKAARMRKRPARPKEQSGGDTSGQQDSAGPSDPDSDAKAYLLNAIKNLRPVSIDDFVQAAHFLQPDTSSASAPFAVHYDSSSDEDI